MDGNAQLGTTVSKVTPFGVSATNASLEGEAGYGVDDFLASADNLAQALAKALFRYTVKGADKVAMDGETTRLVLRQESQSQALPGYQYIELPWHQSALYITLNVPLGVVDDSIADVKGVKQFLEDSGFPSALLSCLSLIHI